ncbi:hypothetical protein ACI68E_001090 [Malassezia pachydermatis]
MAMLETRASSKLKDPTFFPNGDSNEYENGYNTLPPIPGANIDTTTFVLDGNGTTITTYVTANYDPSKIKRAVIQIHGETRDAWNMWQYLNVSMDQASQESDISKDEIVLAAPMFFDVLDAGAYPVDQSNTSNSHSLIWDSNSWGEVLDATYPVYDQKGKLANPPFQTKSSNSSKKSKNGSSNKRSVLESRKLKTNVELSSDQQSAGLSSGDVLDKYVNYFTNTTMFPNMKKVVISGFSRGGQVAARHLAMNTNMDKVNMVHYLIASPASYMYLDNRRPLPVPENCTTFNEYKYGLDGSLPAYYTRQKDTPEDIRNRVLQWEQFYLVGQSDGLNSDTSCEAMTQGKGHVDRMVNWVTKELTSMPNNPTPNKIPDHIYSGQVSGVGHNAFDILTSPAGIQALFVHDYNGENKPASGQRPLQPGRNGVVPEKLNGAESLYARMPPSVIAVLCFFVSLALIM